MSRSLLEIDALDEEVQTQLRKFGPLHEFRISLWRHEPDATGCNWNAGVKRINGNAKPDQSLGELVPELRARFNLK